MHVEVGKEGRIVLPKEIREKKEIAEKTRIIGRERRGEIVLIPVKKYVKPTQSLLGSVKPLAPVDDPKSVAREHAMRKAVEGIPE
jgi:bifunctional DNA-binding transcriptional regulator/antitoxin component of YhaV-PrlF toxin-antitoxin module